MIQRFQVGWDLTISPLLSWQLRNLKSQDDFDVNLAAIKHYGYNRSEFLSMKISDIRPSEEIPALMEEVQETRRVNPYFAVGVFKHLKKNGEIILVEIRANPINYKGRKARVVLANDITEKIKYIESIELQNRNLSEIAWIQSHLVRAPLARIMGIIQMFEHNKLMPEIEKRMFFEHIITSAHELDELIMEISQKAYLAKTKFEEE